MNTFLLIDTATPTCSVALSHGQEIIFSQIEHQPEGGASAHAGLLVEKAISTLREKELSLTAIGISAGPGSYTGLRIGSALAKGLCHGFGVPLIAVSTLRMMMMGYKSQRNNTCLAEDIRIVPMIDARRNEVYTATYTWAGETLLSDRPVLLNPEIPFAEDMQDYTYHFVGNGASKCLGLWGESEYVVDSNLVPDAQHMRTLVDQLYNEGEYTDVAYWTPNYLKEYVATIARNKVLG